MVRAPCCEKMGLKKGPWTPEEDQTLVSYIQRYGHGNWRALPKQAGLLRCGKSCRLRWINYLRPDIKRGNFTREEEETIIKLHELLGNRWSAIAARLPGRTDNEIKNVWHTHLKKRVLPNPTPSALRRHCPSQAAQYPGYLEMKPVNFPFQQAPEVPRSDPVSPRHSSSDSSVVTGENYNYSAAEFHRTFGSEAVSAEQSKPAVSRPQHQHENNESMDFWMNLLVENDSLLELPEF